ncbi:translation initiation factor IF-2 [archaeon]|jgi:translation initiation factor 5B|nr:translation initiation factor IF-2 [archaeon]MBT7128410.1 translation initiation factor IF-2 [archaeon]
MTIRQPIVTVAGHVDHGKTSILDKIRGTSIQTGEAGGITQKISFTTLPKENIEERAKKTLDKFQIPLEIPGLLFIDTPGHAAFTNMRKHGGSLADIAILVIDVNDGIKPQTAEVLQILKANKTPFIIALNKIDNISGWQTSKDLLSLNSLDTQAVNVKTNFEEKFYTIIGSLHSHGITADMYSKIEDFTKSVAIVPCSAETGEGISEILAMITALSQKFLKDKIICKELGKGVVLEVKKDKRGSFLECIFYDGCLKNTDQIAIASLEGDPVTTKIRTIQEALPLNKGYQTRDSVTAATGLKLQINTKEEILPGMPIQVITKENTIEKITEEFESEISEEIQTSNSGIIAKADSLGSLQALMVLLKQAGIPVLKASIGPISKKDIYSCNAIQEEEDKVIIGFNIQQLEETQDLDEVEQIKIITNEIVYKLIEDLEKYKAAKLQEIEKKKLSELPTICKLKVLDFCFRNTSPAVFGVKIEAGNLKAHERFINTSDKKIGQVKEIQHEKKSVNRIESGKEVAVSMPGVNFERQLTIGEFLYTNLGESHFRKFKEHKNLLSSEEKSILQEIAQIKRRTSVTWGI